MLKSIYQRWYLQWFFKLNGCIPIEPGPSSEQTLKEIGALLNQGEVVCLFPEGKISKTGQLDVFRRGYESACKIANDSLVVVPFYIQGLWGSKFSKSANKSKSPGSRWCYRKLHVAFGQPLDKNVSAERVKQQVARLSGCRSDRGRCVQ
jgi:acyl-[acyl-carrier-protein]-phospholipid O-acyltransferase/long-chain-fatty-acid--[acyl-carrier-protein] ligase